MTGTELRAQRKSKGWTQLDLAQRIGVSKSTVINYEMGKTIPESKTRLLAAVFLEEEIKRYPLPGKLKILNSEFSSLAKKQDNPSQFILEQFLNTYHPIEIVDYLERNRDVFFKVEEFRLLVKNIVGTTDIQNLKDEIKKINKRLDDM